MATRQRYPPPKVLEANLSRGIGLLLTENVAYIASRYSPAVVHNSDVACGGGVGGSGIRRVKLISCVWVALSTSTAGIVSVCV